MSKKRIIKKSSKSTNLWNFLEEQFNKINEDLKVNVNPTNNVAKVNVQIGDKKEIITVNIDPSFRDEHKTKTLLKNRIGVGINAFVIKAESAEAFMTNIRDSIEKYLQKGFSGVGSYIGEEGELQIKIPKNSIIVDENIEFVVKSIGDIEGASETTGRMAILALTPAREKMDILFDREYNKVMEQMKAKKNEEV